MVYWEREENEKVGEGGRVVTGATAHTGAVGEERRLLCI